ncbi:hypothetical protein PG990_002688 [Apiospora arundinis]
MPRHSIGVRDSSSSSSKQLNGGLGGGGSGGVQRMPAPMPGQQRRVTEAPKRVARCVIRMSDVSPTGYRIKSGY